MPGQDEKPDIYPPEIFNELMRGKEQPRGGIPTPGTGGENPPPEPDPEGVARDRYLGELAREADRAPEETPEPKK